MLSRQRDRSIEWTAEPNGIRFQATISTRIGAEILVLIIARREVGSRAASHYSGCLYSPLHRSNSSALSLACSTTRANPGSARSGFMNGFVSAMKRAG